MVWPAIIAAAGSAAGSVGGGLTGSLINANVAGIDRDDRRYYAEHAHQVETEDLKRAGLNPILSAGGSGASFQGASGSDIGSGVAAGVDSAAKTLGQIPQMIQNLQIGKATEDKLMADAENTREQTKVATREWMGKDMQNSLLAGAVDKLNIDKKFWDRSAYADYVNKLWDIDTKRAGVEATSASADHFRANIDKLFEETKNLRSRHGFENKYVGDAVNAIDRGIEWLKNPTPPPIGQSSAKSRRR